MNAKKRHQIIIQLLSEKGAITVAELCELFNVSDMTVRRDLSTLASAGLVRRIYGGAVSGRRRSFEPPFLTRAQESQQVKEAIGAYAASLVSEGDSIALDVGTTTLEMARNLSRLRAITVITASLPIVNVLVDYTDIQVILAGGILRLPLHRTVPRRQPRDILGGLGQKRLAVAERISGLARGFGVILAGPGVKHLILGQDRLQFGACGYDAGHRLARAEGQDPRLAGGGIGQRADGIDKLHHENPPFRAGSR